MHERDGPAAAADLVAEDGRAADVRPRPARRRRCDAGIPTARRILLVHEHAGRSQLFRLDARSGASSSRSRPSRAPSRRRMARPGRRDLVPVERRRRPRPRCVSCGATGPVASCCSRQGIEAPAGVRYTDLRVGDVHAFVAEPPTGPRPYPTIFVIHGGPEAHDRDTFSPPVQAWLDHGLAVVLVNYRGSTGYGRAWRDALTGNPGLTELQDIAAVRQRVVDEGIADPQRIVLSGGSWGGYLTLLGLGTQPDRWSLGVALVPGRRLRGRVRGRDGAAQGIRPGALRRDAGGGSPSATRSARRSRTSTTCACRC